jgi:translation initiation factor 1
MPKIVYQEFGDREPEEEPIIDLPPQQHNLKVQASRKGKGGKTVTIISGFQVSPATLTALTKQIKNQCGTGGTVKDGQIEIQGDRRTQVVEILTAIGYKAKISGG